MRERWARARWTCKRRGVCAGGKLGRIGRQWYIVARRAGEAGLPWRRATPAAPARLRSTNTGGSLARPWPPTHPIPQASLHCLLSISSSSSSSTLNASGVYEVRVPPQYGPYLTVGREGYSTYRTLPHLPWAFKKGLSLSKRASSTATIARVPPRFALRPTTSLPYLPYQLTFGRGEGVTKLPCLLALLCLASPYGPLGG